MNQTNFDEESKVRFDDGNDFNQASNFYGQDQTFLSQNGGQNNKIWKAFDFLFPAGKLAKLVRVYDTLNKDFPWGDILYKLKLTEGFPIINLIGAKDAGRGKFLAGIARAAFNCDAVIIDSGIGTGIEKYTLRRGVKLFGVAPESEVKFPKINPTFVDPAELTNGHTNLFLLNDVDREFTWGQEVWFKTALAKKVAEGTGPKGTKRTDGKQRCKIVHVFLGDTPHYVDELRLAVKDNTPVIIVRGSKICNSILNEYAPKDEQEQDQNQDNEQDGENQQKPQEELVELEEELKTILNDPNGHFFYLNSEDSEDIAQFLHFLLTVTPFDDGFEKRRPQLEEVNGEIVVKEPEQQQQQNNNDNTQNQPNDDEDD